MTTPAALKARKTRRENSDMMTQFLRDYERFVGGRVTVELIRSPEWKQAVKEYIAIFKKLMEAK